MKKTELVARLKQRFTRCSSEQITMLARYAGLVDRFRGRMNLTAASDAASYDEILFSDAGTLDNCLDQSQLSNREALRCVDVGAGAGAPALPLCILRPNVSFTLVEPLRKRVSFLRTAIGSLGLAHRARVLEQKLDWDNPSVEGTPFDLAISRATVAPELWLDRGPALASHIALFHSSFEHTHPRLTIEAESRQELEDGRQRFVGIFQALGD